MIRLNFKNGTRSDFITYNFLNGTGDMPLSALIDYVNVRDLYFADDSMSSNIIYSQL